MPGSYRLVSYNILEGLRPLPPASNERRRIDRDRAKATRQVVADLAPDILVLNEALFCRQYAGKTIDYADMFGFPYQSAALYDDAWGNAILSRYPIAKSHEMRIYNRGGLVAILDTPDGQLTIASYHPHPARYPENKAQDFARLVDNLTGPLIVCGDMNCISPEDKIDRGRLIEAFRRFSKEAETALDRFIKSGKLVFEALEEIGLKDAVPLVGRRYSIPTDLIDLNKDSAIRIDHILVNHAIEITAGEVVHSPASNQASDHHPVLVEFQIQAT